MIRFFIGHVVVVVTLGRGVSRGSTEARGVSGFGGDLWNVTLSKTTKQSTVTIGGMHAADVLRNEDE